MRTQGKNFGRHLRNCTTILFALSPPPLRGWRTNYYGTIFGFEFRISKFFKSSVPRQTRSPSGINSYNRDIIKLSFRRPGGLTQLSCFQMNFVMMINRDAQVEVVATPSLISVDDVIDLCGRECKIGR